MKCLSKHRKCWVIGGGGFLWCYECGAIRPNAYGKLKWAYPVGPKGDNPSDVTQEWNDLKKQKGP